MNDSPRAKSPHAKTTPAKSREEMFLEMQKRAYMAQLPRPSLGLLPELQPKLPPKPRPITDVPEDILITIRVRMYALGALVWDYVDTVLDMARSMRPQELRKLCRAVKELRADYDYMRSLNVDRNHLEQEMQWALDFETYVAPLTREFINGLKREQSDTYGELDEDTNWLMTAEQQALCVLEALMHYAKGCDMALAKYGVDMRNKTILPKHFRKLAILLPEFGGDTLVNSEARKKAAADIAKELTKIVVSDKEGDLAQPEL